METCQSHGCSNLDDYLCRDPDYVSYVVNYCPNPHCVRDDFCIGFGNGVCDNEPDADGVSLNSDVCDWDGGDCCQITCSAQNCSSNPADYPIEQCLDPEPIELEIIISVVVAAVVVGIAVTVVVVVYLKQRMKRAVTRARDAKRIITLVEDTAYSIPFHHLKIGKLLAAGGAGQVYEGTFSGQPVAIKELFSVLFDPGFLEDLKAEAVRTCIRCGLRLGGGPICFHQHLLIAPCRFFVSGYVGVFASPKYRPILRSQQPRDGQRDRLLPGDAVAKANPPRCPARLRTTCRAEKIRAGKRGVRKRAYVQVQPTIVSESHFQDVEGTLNQEPSICLRCAATGVC